MAALQILVSGVAQNVARFVTVESPVTAPTLLSNSNFISSVTNLITVDNPVVSPTSVLINGNKFFANNITRLVEIPSPNLNIVHLGGGVASPRAQTGGASAPVSKESWE